LRINNIFEVFISFISDSDWLLSGVMVSYPIHDQELMHHSWFGISVSMQKRNEVFGDFGFP